MTDAHLFVGTSRMFTAVSVCVCAGMSGRHETEARVLVLLQLPR